MAVSSSAETMIVADAGTRTDIGAAGVIPRVRRMLAADNSPVMPDVARKNLSEFADIGIVAAWGTVRAGGTQ